MPDPIASPREERVLGASRRRNHFPIGHPFEEKAKAGPPDTTLNLILTDPSGPVAHARVTSDFVGSEGRSKLPAAVTVSASAGWQRLVWLAPRR